MIAEGCDTTGKGVGVTRDAELDEHRAAVVVRAVTDEIWAVELEDGNEGQVYSAARRREAPEGSSVGTAHASFDYDPVTVVAQLALLDVEVHVGKGGEELTIGGGDGVVAIGDFSGQFHARSAIFESRHRRRNIVSVLGFEMSKNRSFARLPYVRRYLTRICHSAPYVVRTS